MKQSTYENLRETGRPNGRIEPMKTKHTRGPWIHNLKHPSVMNGVQILANSGGNCLQGSFLKAICTMEKGEGLTANARLIAAAPEMLEALRDALCRLGDSDIPQSEHLTDLLGKGWDAIAKAEGKDWE